MREAEVSHRIAVEAATAMVRRGIDAGLSWRDIAISGETVIAIVVAACAELSGQPDRTQLAAELVDTMTEHAHKRVVALMLGVPYAG